MNFDVIARVGDVPNEARERKVAQIAMAEPRAVTDMHGDPRCANVALPSAENRTQLAGELRFELLFGTGSFHVSSLARKRSAPGIELLRQLPFGRGPVGG